MPRRDAAAGAIREFVKSLDVSASPAPDAELTSLADYGATMNARYDELEAKLVARGFPPTSPWWRKQVRRYFNSACRQAVFRVGRRGGKSTTICRVGVIEALYGRHNVPPGDVGTVAIVSVDRREAGRRVRTIKEILDAIKVAWSPCDGGIELRGKPFAFQVFAASIAGVSGFTAVFVFCDEVAKWKDADTGANPATEVLASIRPTMATMPSARMVLSSSPLGTLDAHAKAFDKGDSETQFVASAPTWEANPTITEDATHELEPDEATRLREYGAIPIEGNEESILSPLLLDAIKRGPQMLPPLPGYHYVAYMDPATSGNGWTLCVVTRDGLGRRVLALCHEWRGTPSEPLDPDIVFREMAEMLNPADPERPRYGVTRIGTDHWSNAALASCARRHGLTLMGETLTMSRKVAMWKDVAVWIMEKTPDGRPMVEIPDHQALRTDILGARRKVTQSGLTVTYVRTPDGRHSDFAPAFLGAIHAHCKLPTTFADLTTPEGLTAHWAEQEKRGLEVDLRDARRQQGAKKGAWWRKSPFGAPAARGVRRPPV